MALANVHRFTTDEFLAIDGLPRRVELVEGVICDMSSEGPPHGRGQELVLRALMAALPDWSVVAGGSIRATSDYCPIPDAAVYGLDRPDPSAFYGADEARLVVEVGVTSAIRDRTIKLPAYAAARVEEVWLVEPEAGRISRHRDPDDGRFRDETVLGWPDGLDLLVQDLVARLNG